MIVFPKHKVWVHANGYQQSMLSGALWSTYKTPLPKADIQLVLQAHMLLILQLTPPGLNIICDGFALAQTI